MISDDALEVLLAAGAVWYALLGYCAAVILATRGEAVSLYYLSPLVAALALLIVAGVAQNPLRQPLVLAAILYPLAAFGRPLLEQAGAPWWICLHAWAAVPWPAALFLLVYRRGLERRGGALLIYLAGCLLSGLWLVDLHPWRNLSPWIPSASISILFLAGAILLFQPPALRAVLGGLLIVQAAVLTGSTVFPVRVGTPLHLYVGLGIVSTLFAVAGIAATLQPWERGRLCGRTRA